MTDPTGKPLPAHGRGVLYIDAGAGAAGDMILGAFVDLGVPLEHLRAELLGMGIDGFDICASPVTRCGLAAQQVEVALRESPAPARRLVDLERIIGASQLDGPVQARALSVFRRLIKAEAEAHGEAPERVHLHEAGGLDAIVDVVGASIALEFLGAPKVHVSPMTLGFGTVTCAHGVFPVPAPATLALVRGFPVRGGNVEAERLTPTGAAILTTFADTWGALPACRPLAVGSGAGSRDLPGAPNALRMVLAESLEDRSTQPDQEIAVIECTLDDSTPQVLAFTAERLLDGGALDTFTTAVAMKKGRPGHNLTVLAPAGRVQALTDVLLRETSTLGLRIRYERRVAVERSWTTVETPWGPVRVKVGTGDGHRRKAWPEYEDCAALARRARVPLREVQFAALSAFDQKTGAESRMRRGVTRPDPHQPRRSTHGRRTPDPAR